MCTKLKLEPIVLKFEFAVGSISAGARANPPQQQQQNNDNHHVCV
jgi:hypothetical protein